MIRQCEAGHFPTAMCQRSASRRPCVSAIGGCRPKGRGREDEMNGARGASALPKAASPTQFNEPVTVPNQARAGEKMYLASGRGSGRFQVRDSHCGRSWGGVTLANSSRMAFRLERSLSRARWAAAACPCARVNRATRASTMENSLT
jgi:hypothetical protein